MAIITIIALAAVSYFIFLYIKLRPYNQGALKIKTFDGTDSPYHPSVLYFKEGWNGYKYWMAETPFSPKSKPYEDRNECPSIHVSNNGIDWAELINNPIDDLNEKEVEELDYFSDPHLVFVNGGIECWYRFTHRKGITNNYNNLQLVRKTSKDGVNWSEREILVNLATNEGNSLGNMVVSPAILYQDGKYRMWYVNSESRVTRGLSYSESNDGKVWKEYKKCTLNGIDNMPWHIDVNRFNGKYYLISYDLNNISIFESENGIDFYFVKKLLSPSVTGSFYNYRLYRACIIKDSKYKVYFSAHDSLKTYIGLMEGENIHNLNIRAICRHQSSIGLLNYIVITKWRSVKFITRRLIKLLRLKNA
ncbi:MAG: hypothetical protein IJB01_10215 [Bacteroidaceae bacterium]|nr:hypothetical protein [Bacteroidaceae bacterium]